MLRFLSAVALAGTAAFGATYNVVTNFNAPINSTLASPAFSYGTGATSSGFTPMTNSTANCIGTPSYCTNNGGPFLSTSEVTWNGMGAEYVGGTVHVPVGYIRLDPQGTAGTIVRFTVPTTGMYSIVGNFAGIDSSQHGTSVHVYANNASVFSSNITAFGGLAPFNISSSAFAAGDTVDFVVSKISDPYDLSTGLAATISTPNVAGVPEPASIVLVALALPAILLRRFAK